MRLHYRVAGRGHRGTPVVCIPAPGDSTGALAGLVDALGRTHLSFAYDLPGHGRSGNPPVDRPDPTWWLLAWIARLGFEHCHLVVVDDALGLALQAAQRDARRLLTVSVLQPPPLEHGGVVRRVRQTAALLADLRRNPRGARSAASWARSRTAAGFVAAMHPRNLDRQSRYLQLPTAVIRGEHDPISALHDATGLARMLDAELLEVAGAGRHCHTTHARQTADALVEWWRTTEQSKQPGGAA